MFFVLSNSKTFLLHSVWIKETKNQKQITSFNEIKSVLTSGEKVRWVINMMDCKCPDGTMDDDCSNNYIGNTITGLYFKSWWYSFSFNLVNGINPIRYHSID